MNLRGSLAKVILHIHSTNGDLYIFISFQNVIIYSISGRHCPRSTRDRGEREGLKYRHLLRSKVSDELWRGEKSP